ncbi:MAG: DUF6152 family protein [Gammaproteobacteria bacterium]
MKPKHLVSFACAMLAAAALAPAAAHHSFAAVFDGSKIVTLDGTIKEFKFVNPHALATIDVTDDKGAVQPWTVEFDGRLNLTNFGWTDATIRSGERVKISGNPERTGAPRIFFSKLVRADGTAVVRGGDRLNAIEEDRRLRAAQRATSTPAK